MPDPKRTHRRRLESVLPSAYEDYPWEVTVVTMNKKIFVFLEIADSPTWPAITVELRIRTRRPSAFPTPTQRALVAEVDSATDEFLRDRRSLLRRDRRRGGRHEDRDQ